MCHNHIRKFSFQVPEAFNIIAIIKCKDECKESQAVILIGSFCWIKIVSSTAKLTAFCSFNFFKKDPVVKLQRI